MSASLESLADRVPSSLLPSFRRITGAGIGGRLARGTFWVLCGAAIARGLQLLSSIITARVLGQTAFGEFGLLQTTLTMVTTFTSFGLGLTAMKYVAELRTTSPRRAGRILHMANLTALLTGGIGGTVLFLSAPWLATVTLKAGHLTDLLRIGALLILVSSVSGALTGALSGFEAFQVIARLSLIAGLAAFPICTLGVLFWGIDGAVWALVLVAALGCALNWRALVRETKNAGLRFERSGWLSEVSVLWRFSAPAFLSGALVPAVYWTCNTILVREPAGYAQLAIYSAANVWRLAILFVPGAIGTALTPILSSLTSANQSLQRMTRISLALNTALSLLVAAPIAIASPWLMGAYGDGFRQGVPTLVCVVGTAVLMASVGVLHQAFVVLERNWQTLAFTAIWGVLTVLLTWHWRGQGALGIAKANLVSHAVHLAVYALYYRALRGSLQVRPAPAVPLSC